MLFCDLLALAYINMSVGVNGLQQLFFQQQQFTSFSLRFNDQEKQEELNMLLRFKN
jgi:hypothetical protein